MLLPGEAEHAVGLMQWQRQRDQVKIEIEIVIEMLPTL